MLKRKLLARRGETLAEVLVAILVCGISITMLAGMIMTSMSINQAAREMDAGADGHGGFYGALSHVETYVFTGEDVFPDGESGCSVKLTGGGSDITLNARSYTEDGLSVYGEVAP